MRVNAEWEELATLIEDAVYDALTRDQANPHEDHLPVPAPLDAWATAQAGIVARNVMSKLDGVD